VKDQVSRKRITVAKKFGRLHVFGIIAALTVLVVGAVTVLSRQPAKVKEAKKQETASVMPAVMPDQPKKNYVTVKVGGQDIKVDSQTGQIQELTPEEAQRLAAGLKPMLNRSSDGLVTVQHPDGSMSMDLQGRFQNVTVARVNKDGTVSQSCVNNPRAAGAFFGIDPKLIENAPDQTRVKPGVNKN
jgi:Na+-translocating ferredoxin:NAD+ oxidoreductase RnfG subunit